MYQRDSRRNVFARRPVGSLRLRRRNKLEGRSHRRRGAKTRRLFRVCGLFTRRALHRGWLRRPRSIRDGDRKECAKIRGIRTRRAINRLFTRWALRRGLCLLGVHTLGCGYRTRAAQISRGRLSGSLFTGWQVHCFWPRYAADVGCIHGLQTARFGL